MKTVCSAALILPVLLAACAPERAPVPEPPVVEPASTEADAEDTWTARGQEPGWLLTLEGSRAEFGYNYNQDQYSAELSGPAPVEGGVEYTEGPGGLAVTRISKVCADVMSGIPYPDTVTVTLGDEVFHGCGGDPKAVLTGAEWVVEDIGNRGVIDTVRVTIVFETAEGRAGGSGGCNNWGADYALSGEGIRFGDAVSTEMACEEAVMNQEQAFHAALRAVTSYAVDETGALVMTGPDGARILARR